MGNFFVEITLENAADAFHAREGRIAENQVRQVTLSALVDTGASTLMIGEETSRQLGLQALRPYKIRIAGDSTLEGMVTSPVTIHWKDRIATVDAVVMPGTSTLLGAIPLEFMDLIVDPTSLQLVGAHGDTQTGMAL